jgi:hypothetical protein
MIGSVSIAVAESVQLKMVETRQNKTLTGSNTLPTGSTPSSVRPGRRSMVPRHRIGGSNTSVKWALIDCVAGQLAARTIDNGLNQ